MANDILNLVWQSAPHFRALGFLRSQFYLLVRLADRAQPEDSELGEYGESWPSIQSLADDTFQSPQNARNGLAKFIPLGVITIIAKGGGRLPNGKGRTTHFRDEVNTLKKLVEGIPLKEPSSRAAKNPPKMTQNPTVATGAESSLRTVSEPSCIDARLRDDGSSTQRSLEEIVKSFEQSGGKLEIRHDKAWIIKFPPGDYENHPDYISLKDLVKVNGGSQLVAVLRSRGVESSTGQEF
jgi:hypothetical protein